MGLDNLFYVQAKRSKVGAQYFIAS